MNLRVDNKIFVPYCMALTGLIGGGLIYSVINDKKKQQFNKVHLMQPSTLKNIRLLFESKTNIPIEYSFDRRTASLGAAWKKFCS